MEMKVSAGETGSAISLFGQKGVFRNIDPVKDRVRSEQEFI
ncbi:MAG: hypothetical protein Q7S01_05095 [bacterium]|nr:hypothetical protein [bacterium]